MPDLPRDAFVFSAVRAGARAVRRGNGVRIGRDDADGEILLLDSGPVLEYQYGDTYVINSTLEQYRASLILVGDALASGRELHEDEVQAHEHAMRRVDPMVRDTSGAYWDGVVEEIGYGLI